MKIIKQKDKEVKITTLEMELAVAKYFNARRNIIVPNISWGFNVHECDLIVIAKSGYMYEIEIKISKSDLLNDFKKNHQHQDTKNRINKLYYAIPDYLYESCKDLIPNNAGILVVIKHKYENDECYSYTTVLRKQPEIIKNSRKLTLDEQFKISTLGCLRIFNLKDKILKLKNKISEKL